MNTNTNAEQLSAQSKQITIVQNASPPPVENSQTILQNPNPPNSIPFSKQATIVQNASPPPVENSQTILQNPNPANSISPAVLADDLSLPQKPRVAKQIGSSSQPTQIVETTNRTRNPLAQFSSENDSKNLNAEATVVQHNNPIIQQSESIAQNFTKGTIIQYSDSAIHNRAEQTVCQTKPSSSTNLDRTLIQSKMPPHLSTPTTMPEEKEHIQPFYPNIRHMFRTLGSFWRKIDLKQLQSFFHLNRQPAIKNLEQASSDRFNRSTHSAIASGEQLSLEQYQKKLRELDLCRLCFAKELARNGKFRSAIFEAEQISETSYFFKDAQTLIQSWKQF